MVQPMGDDLDPDTVVEKPRVKKAKKITFKKPAQDAQSQPTAAAPTDSADPAAPVQPTPASDHDC